MPSQWWSFKPRPDSIWNITRSYANRGVSCDFPFGFAGFVWLPRPPESSSYSVSCAFSWPWQLSFSGKWPGNSNWLSAKGMDWFRSFYWRSFPCSRCTETPDSPWRFASSTRCRLECRALKWRREACNSCIFPYSGGCCHRYFWAAGILRSKSSFSCSWFPSWLGWPEWSGWHSRFKSVPPDSPPNSSSWAPTARAGWGSRRTEFWPGFPRSPAPSGCSRSWCRACRSRVRARCTHGVYCSRTTASRTAISPISPLSPSFCGICS